MGRSVSYPSGAVVAFTVLKSENDDDWEFEYDWLREDLSERAVAAFPSIAPHAGWRGREDRILLRGHVRGLRCLGLWRAGCGLDSRTR